MDLGNIHDYAKLLIDLHGSKAEVEAARKIRELEQEGESESSKLENWQKIRLAIREMRGAHES